MRPNMYPLVQTYTSLAVLSHIHFHMDWQNTSFLCQVRRLCPPVSLLEWTTCVIVFMPSLCLILCVYSHSSSLPLSISSLCIPSCICCLLKPPCKPELRPDPLLAPSAPLSSQWKSIRRSACASSLSIPPWRREVALKAPIMHRHDIKPNQGRWSSRTHLPSAGFVCEERAEGQVSFLRPQSTASDCYCLQLPVVCSGRREKEWASDGGEDGENEQERRRKERAKR